MNIEFLGAAHEVTGSCTLLRTDTANILIDCGMEQGADTYENAALPINPGDIDYLFLTHAHIDHSGKIPLLCAQGFRGKIFATGATVKLCNIMLQDSAYIQESEAFWRNKKAKRAGKEEYIPLYTVQDAVSAMKYFIPCAYEKEIRVCPGISIKFIDAGHLLGSASIEITLCEDGAEKTIVFSGDIGNLDQPLLKNPTYVHHADYVIMESTYGDKGHGERIDYVEQLVPIIQRTFDRGGNVVIPSFAVGRTQELLYFLRIIKEKGLVKNHDGFSVYVDSPLAIEATQIFQQDMYEYFDDEALDLISRGINPIQFDGLITTTTSDESKSINENPQPKIIISASGMCEAGRIRHHLKHNLWRKECSILFVGYQALGTLGRRLTEGAREVRLFGEDITVSADICMIRGISGHADNEGLMTWIQALKTRPEKVFINHGDDAVCEIFAGRLRNELGIDAVAPFPGAVYDLLQNACLDEGNKKKLEKQREEPGKKYSPVFFRLENAGKRLLSVIKQNHGGTNKDLAKFTDQILALCDKWER